MKKLLTVLILIPALLLSPRHLFADEAKTILANLSKKIDSYSSLYIEYSIVTENKQKASKSTESGKVVASKNKFKLTSKGLEVYSDGITQWLFLTDEKEVTISKANMDKDDIFSNPIKFLTGQRKDFKYQYKGEIDVNGTRLTEIDYYPKDLKATYSIIRMHIDQSSMQVVTMHYFGKDGTDYQVKLNKYLPNVKVVDQDFTFDGSIYPDLETVDLR